MHKNVAGATFTVSDGAEASRIYMSASNPDIDDDSNGTVITVLKP
jgi:hypothetical protein